MAEVHLRRLTIYGLNECCFQGRMPPNEVSLSMMRMICLVLFLEPAHLVKTQEVAVKVWPYCGRLPVRRPRSFVCSPTSPILLLLKSK